MWWPFSKRTQQPQRGDAEVRRVVDRFEAAYRSLSVRQRESIARALSPTGRINVVEAPGLCKALGMFHRET